MAQMLTSEEVTRYSRHLIIPEVDFEGQQKLKDASVLIVGAGGLGSPLSLYLAAAGVGHLGIADYDVVEMSNLQRQVAHGMSTLGMNKAESARRRMLDINPMIQVDTSTVPFTAENARSVAEGYDIVVDGTDNFPTRYLINDLCVLTGRPFVFGGVYLFEGQVSVFNAQNGPCYRCLFPEPPAPGLVPSCAEVGVFGVAPGIVGMLQAAETIKLILGLGSSLAGTLLLVDALEMSFHRIAIERNPGCKICGDEPQIHDLIDYKEFCGVPFPGEPVQVMPGLEITPAQLAERLKNPNPPRLLDVRQFTETRISSLPGAEVIPYLSLPQHLSRFDPDEEIVVFCRSGIRSRRAQDLLFKAGYRKVWNLCGGINAWASEVDPRMNQY